MEWMNVGGLSEKVGAKMVTIKSGANKQMISMFRDPSPEERSILESLVQDSYEQFIQAVLQGRPELTEEALRKLADGRVFTGKQAKTHGLIDDFASSNQALHQLAKDLDIQGDIHTIQFNEEPTDMSSFFGKLGWSSVKEWLPTPPVSGVRLSYLFK